MSAIVNLYLVPEATALTARALVADAVEALLDAAYVTLPARIGPLRSSTSAIVQPEAALHSALHREVALRDDAVDDARGMDAAIVLFRKINEAHPDVRREFPHDTGHDCALAFYVSEDPVRLLLQTEDFSAFGGDPARVLLDRGCHAWAHLQGKRAPHVDAFEASSLGRVFRRVWPALKVIENDWV